METALRALKQLLVTLRRDPQFGVTALVTMALGIGATTAVFSVVYCVLLRPLPYAQPDRLVMLYEEHPGAPKPPGEPVLSNTTFYAWRDRLTTLEAVAGYGSREFSVRLEGETSRLHGAEVSPSLFALLGAAPQAGRFFAEGEERPKPSPVVVLSDRLWRERLGGERTAVGRSLVVDGRACEIVGIAPAGFAFPDRETALWTPFEDPTLTDASVQGGMWLLQGIGRLRPGVTAADAGKEGTTIARALPRPAVAKELFGTGGPVVVHADVLASGMTSAIRPVLIVLATSVVFVLLVACANVANLFLSRGVTRQRELALRSAIGASRGRLIRELLTETFALAACGGLAGLAIAVAIVRAVPAIAPESFPRLDAIQLDSLVVWFAVGATAVTALLSGIAPALHGARFDLAAILRGGDGAIAGGFRGARAVGLRRAFLVAESALAALLLVGAALLGRSFVHLTHVDAGYDPANVLIARVYQPSGASKDRAHAFIASLVDRLRADGRVVAAGAGNMMPFSDATWITAFDVPATLGAGKATHVQAVQYVVTPGYADALGLRLNAGRFLIASDQGATYRRVVVNDEFVRQYVSGEPVVGRTFTNNRTPVTSEIVGVVGDVLKDGHDTRARPELYAIEEAARPLLDEVDLVVRTAGNPTLVASSLHSLVRDLDPDAALGRVEPLASRVSASMAQPRLAASVLWLFAGLAIALAAVGLYGVLSYAVSQQRRELSVRAVLGADRGDLVRLVLREGLGLTAIGLAIGIGAAIILARLISGLLFGVTPLDAVSYLTAPAVLVPIAIAACARPALRAARIDPNVALRDG